MTTALRQAQGPEASALRDRNQPPSGQYGLQLGSHMAGENNVMIPNWFC